MTLKVFTTFLTLFYLSFYANSVRAAQETIPAKILVHGVPYISWNEALQHDYPDKNILNPASPATQAMLLSYWGVDANRVLKGKALPTANWVRENKKGKGLDELKELVATGIPVLIAPMPLTSVAHPLYFVFGLSSIIRDKKGPEAGLCSWMSGQKMAPLDWFHEFRMTEGKGEFNPLGESLYLAARVMVGYDNDRQVVILHDSTYGPGWEVNYDTFDKMWQQTDRGYLVLHPPDFAELLRKRKPAKQYRKRTPNERAAFHLHFGCGLSTVDRLQEAEEQLAKGVAIKGISKGYRHILLFELARHQAARNGIDEAIKSAKAATDALPKNYYAWEYLADLFRMRGVGKKEEKAAKRAEKKSKKLKNQGSATKSVIRALPSDFWIPELAKVRGWGVASAKSGSKSREKRQPK